MSPLRTDSVKKHSLFQFSCSLRPKMILYTLVLWSLYKCKCLLLNIGVKRVLFQTAAYKSNRLQWENRWNEERSGILTFYTDRSMTGEKRKETFLPHIWGKIQQNDSEKLSWYTARLPVHSCQVCFRFYKAPGSTPSACCPLQSLLFAQSW